MLTIEPIAIDFESDRNGFGDIVIQTGRIKYQMTIR